MLSSLLTVHGSLRMVCHFVMQILRSFSGDHCVLSSLLTVHGSLKMVTSSKKLDD